jgi:hypothetical protein
MKIIYEPHPINPARKAKLQAQGYKIIDAIFAPAGAPLHEKLEIEEGEEIAFVPAPEIAQEPEEVVKEAEAAQETDNVSEAEKAPKRGRSRKD